MEKMFKLSMIIAIASITLFSCKPKPILLPVLDDYDRKILEHIKKEAHEGDSLIKLAKELPENSSLPVPYDLRVQYADVYLKQAQKILEDVQEKRNVVDGILAMKLAMYNKRSYFSKDTIIPEDCKPCYEKLNELESRLTYLKTFEALPNGLKGFESDVCKCVYENK